SGRGLYDASLDRNISTTDDYRLHIVGRCFLPESARQTISEPEDEPGYKPAHRGHNDSLPKRELRKGRDDFRFASCGQIVDNVARPSKALRSQRSEEAYQRSPKKHELAIPKPEAV